MTAISHAATADVWSRYWRTGTVHSCCLDFAGNYSGALADFWNGQFEALPEGAVVIDLGTGNGAIPLLAKAYSERHARNFRLHGVDAADVDPGGDNYDGISFHPSTSMLALPFSDRSVDLISSQFAVEYAPWSEVSAEMARVLSDRGRIACVMHTTDSRIHAATLDQLASFDVLAQSDLIAHARAMAGLLTEADTAAKRAALKQSPAAELARNSLNAAAEQVAARIAQAQVPLMPARTLEAMGEILRSAAVTGAQQTDEILHTMERNLRDEEYRLQHLRQAALSPDMLESAASRLRALGFSEIRTHPVDQSDDMRLGWALTACRG